MRALRNMAEVWACRRGGPAMEFALVAPMMLYALLASFDLTELMTANRRAEGVAASLSDIVARDALVSDDEMADLLNSAAPLLGTTRLSRQRIRITSAVVVQPRRAQVVWSDARGTLAAHRPGALITIPANIGRTATGLVIADFGGDYRPPLGSLGAATITLRHTEYRRPRVADPVGREGVDMDLDDDD
jgi:Flp pilus assembly protein TadG